MGTYTSYPILNNFLYLLIILTYNLRTQHEEVI